MAWTGRKSFQTLALIAALALAAVAIWQLERARAGIERSGIFAGTTPITLYQSAGRGPLVVVAHGFAGSRQLMGAFSLTLAGAGYQVAAFDFLGHGRNPVPMSGDVTAIDGTTARLVAETERVIDAARAATGHEGPIALLGHSMASDVIVRTALNRPEDVAAIVAVSMYSEAVTATAPDNLLIITGDWEPHLRRAALDTLHQLDPQAQEGQTVTSGALTRRAAVAPNVEHVGVLYAPLSLIEAQDWLDRAFDRASPRNPAAIGPWIALLMGALVFAMWPLTRMLGPLHARLAPISARRFLLAAFAPALVAPFLAAQVQTRLLPVMVADTLAVLLLILGLGQLALLWRAGRRPGPLSVPALALLLIWGLGVFGLLLDRYGASFLPIPERLPLIAVLAIGCIPFMLADALLTGAGQGQLWQRLTARLALFLSLGIAVALDPERLFFLVIIFPVLILFFAVHGAMGRWTARHGGATATGIGLGLILAWALGVSFPLYDPTL